MNIIYSPNNNRFFSIFLLRSTRGLLGCKKLTILLTVRWNSQWVLSNSGGSLPHILVSVVAVTVRSLGHEQELVAEGLEGPQAVTAGSLPQELHKPISKSNTPPQRIRGTLHIKCLSDWRKIRQQLFLWNASCKSKQMNISILVMWIGHCGSSAVLRVSNNAAMNIWKMYWTDGTEKLLVIILFENQHNMFQFSLTDKNTLTLWFAFLPKSMRYFGALLRRHTRTSIEFACSWWKTSGRSVEGGPTLLKKPLLLNRKIQPWSWDVFFSIKFEKHEKEIGSTKIWCRQHFHTASSQTLPNGNTPTIGTNTSMVGRYLRKIPQW